MDFKSHFHTSRYPTQGDFIVHVYHKPTEAVALSVGQLIHQWISSCTDKHMHVLLSSLSSLLLVY